MMSRRRGRRLRHVEGRRDATFAPGATSSTEADPTAESEGPRRAVAGISLFLMSLLLAALHIAMSKALVAEVSVPMVVWSRYVVFVLLTLPLAIYRFGANLLRPPTLPLLVLRGALITIGNFLFIASVAGAPLADMTAVLFVYPFIMTALAPLVLGEMNSARSWIATCTGFAGVLLMLRPTSGALNLHGLLALLAGACFGGQLLVTRLASRTAPALLTATFTAIVGALMCSITLPLYGQIVNWHQALQLVLIGVAVTASQASMILACRRTNMATLAPFAYSEIAFAAFMGYVMFQELPDTTAWSGIALIVASGLLVAMTQPANLPSVPNPRRPAT